MDDLSVPEAPEGVDWPRWLERHDRMQERFFVARDERFGMLARLIEQTQEPPLRILDLGCGTGALVGSLLEALPGAEVTGLDLDHTALWLAAARLERFGDRCRLLRSDFLDPSWPDRFDEPLAAVVSTQTLHMLGADQLAPFYRQLARVIRPGGILLCADHVRSDSPAFQRTWERWRDEQRAREPTGDVDDWDGFWAGFSAALGIDPAMIHGHLYGGRRRRKKELLPLSWHLARMLESGFGSVDCFWRREYDAVYGGERG